MTATLTTTRSDDDIRLTTDALHASDAVSCPKCLAQPGHWCTSTGGGNHSFVPTHKARERRVAGWDLAFAAEAGHLARQVKNARYRTGATVDIDFSRFEAAAAPAEAKPKTVTPKGVRLSERQAEEIESYVWHGGYGSVSTAHFHGDAQHRQTVNALEEKGIVEQVDDADHYGRSMRLTEFGWAVYDQHRLIIKRLTDEQVAEQRARAEEGRCISCGKQPGATEDCENCGLTRRIAADEVIKDFNNQHPVGVRVRYWTGARDGEGTVSTTRWGAFFGRGDVPSIRVEGFEGDLLLMQIEVLGAEVVELRPRIGEACPACESGRGPICAGCRIDGGVPA